ncbi:MAG TPA: CDP-alcohol phosphatidyltransferase family protein [Phycisphaerae bacterium]|nr:CDP-alcohol phosphatidyltransferase family protein [Phycisphaerae bacterium]
MKIPIDKQKRWARRRERVLKTVAVLPSLATLGNLVCGLGAIYMCMLSMAAQRSDLPASLGSSKIEHIFPTFLAIAAYLIVGAMAFDGIDGRLARFARKTSEFGAQLDSMADIVSFGVAPAVLVLCVVHPENVKGLEVLARVYWRAEWVMAAVYVCCAALRLARFNVENVADESAHMGFRGLPTPGAACAVVGMVIFHQEMLRDLGPVWAANLVTYSLPPFAAILGLLMVSRIPYPHMINTILRGKRSFRQVVAISILLLVALIQFQLAIAFAAAGYALSGPLARLIARTRHPHKPSGRGEELRLSDPRFEDPMRPAV